MIQRLNRLKWAPVFAALLLLAGPGIGRGQTPGRQALPKESLLDTKVPTFELENQTLLDGIWKLARGPAPFGFGFEKVLKQKSSDPELPDPRISIQLREKSVREVLEALCQADGRYVWSADGSTINLFPKAVADDPAYLINRKLVRFVLKDATDIQDGLLAIVHQLPPPEEQIAIAQVGGAGDPYPPEPWSLTLENRNVREVVNRLAWHGGQCAVWIFGGARDFRAFGFFNTYLCPKKPPTRVPKSTQPPPKSP
jgi:hypothetical protein